MNILLASPSLRGDFGFNNSLEDALRLWNHSFCIHLCRVNFKKYIFHITLLVPGLDWIPLSGPVSYYNFILEDWALAGGVMLLRYSKLCRHVFAALSKKISSNYSPPPQPRLLLILILLFHTNRLRENNSLQQMRTKILIFPLQISY